MSNHWHILILLIIMLILCLTCVIYVRDVGVRTLKYFINFWRLLHRSLGYGALTRLRRQLRIVLPATDQALGHA